MRRQITTGITSNLVFMQQFYPRLIPPCSKTSTSTSYSHNERDITSNNHQWLNRRIVRYWCLLHSSKICVARPKLRTGVRFWDAKIQYDFLVLRSRDHSFNRCFFRIYSWFVSLYEFCGKNSTSLFGGVFRRSSFENSTKNFSITNKHTISK